MPTPTLSRARAQAAVDALNTAIRAGYRVGPSPSATEAAADSLGINASTLRGRLKTAQRIYNLVPDPDIEPPDPEPLVIEPVVIKPRVIVRASSAARPEGEATRLVIIGDAHQAPGMSVDRWKWIARHVGSIIPDRVVQIGDLGEFHSLSGHERPGSVQQKAKPKFQDDLACVEEALAAYRSVLGQTRIPHHITLGNHEHRIWTHESLVAEVEGSLVPQFTDVLARYDWRWTEYRQYVFVNGVALTHVPQALMERPFNGRTLNPIINDLTTSLIFGHSHRHAFINAPKIGPQQRIEVLNVGTAAPHGWFPDYAISEQGGLSWGICEATVQAGHIVRHEFIDMVEMERRYA